jgi:hypothetical protein
VLIVIDLSEERVLLQDRVEADGGVLAHIERRDEPG